MKRTYLLSFLIVAFASINSCDSGNRTGAERKIEGKWKLLFEYGASIDTGSTIEYEFRNNMQYTLVSKENGQVSNTMNGSFAITKDSFTLYYPPHSSKAIYKARVSSLSNDSLVLYDGYSEKHFGKY